MPVVHLALVGTVAALLMPASSHAATLTPTVIASAPPGLVSQLDGRAIYSAINPNNSKTYVLMQQRFGRSPEPVPGVAPRAAPFDADLGRDARGHLVATFSRCAFAPAAADSFTGLPRPLAAQRCTIRQYRFGTAREQPLSSATISGASAVLPSQWGDRIAFAARSPHSRLVSIYLADLQHHTVERIAAGTRGLPADAASGPSSIDLRGERLAFAWRYSPERARAPLCPDTLSYDDRLPAVATEVWLRALSSTRSRRVDLGCSKTASRRMVQGAALTASGTVLSVRASGSVETRVMENGFSRKWLVGTLRRSPVVSLSGQPDSILAAVNGDPGRVVRLTADRSRR